MLGRAILLLIASSALQSLAEPVHHSKVVNSYDRMSVNHRGSLHRDEPSLMRRVVHWIQGGGPKASLVQEYSDEGEYEDEGSEDAGESREYSEDGEESDDEEESEDEYPIVSANGLPGDLSEEEVQEMADMRSDAQVKAATQRQLAMRHQYISFSNLKQIREHSEESSSSSTTYCASYPNSSACDNDPSHCFYDEYAADPECNKTGCFSTVCSDTTKYPDSTACIANVHCFWHEDAKECKFRSCAASTMQTEIPCISNPLCKWDKDNSACKPKPCSQWVGWDSDAQMQGLYCKANQLCEGQETTTPNGATCVATACEGYDQTECGTDTLGLKQGCKWAGKLCKPCYKLTTEADCTGDNNPGNCEWVAPADSNSAGSCRVLCNYTAQDSCESTFHSACQWATAGSYEGVTATASDGVCTRTCEDDAAKCATKTRTDCILVDGVAADCKVLCGTCLTDCNILHQARCESDDSCNWNSTDSSCKRKCDVYSNDMFQCKADSLCMWVNLTQQNCSGVSGTCYNKESSSSSLAELQNSWCPGMSSSSLAAVLTQEKANLQAKSAKVPNSKAKTISTPASVLTKEKANLQAKSAKIPNTTTPFGEHSTIKHKAKSSSASTKKATTGEKIVPEHKAKSSSTTKEATTGETNKAKSSSTPSKSKAGEKTTASESKAKSSSATNKATGGETNKAKSSPTPSKSKAGEKIVPEHKAKSSSTTKEATTGETNKAKSSSTPSKSKVGEKTTASESKAKSSSTSNKATSGETNKGKSSPTPSKSKAGEKTSAKAASEQREEKNKAKSSSTPSKSTAGETHTNSEHKAKTSSTTKPKALDGLTNTNLVPNASVQKSSSSSKTHAENKGSSSTKDLHHAPDLHQQLATAAEALKDKLSKKSL